MLVLSRKKNESIVINHDITVTVVEIRGDKVRLGVVAPKETPVHRQEVYDAIHGRDDASSTPGVSFSGVDRHPDADCIREYTYFILGLGERSPSSDFWGHVKKCRECRRALQRAIAAVEIPAV